MSSDPFSRETTRKFLRKYSYCSANRLESKSIQCKHGFIELDSPQIVQPRERCRIGKYRGLRIRRFGKNGTKCDNRISNDTNQIAFENWVLPAAPAPDSATSSEDILSFRRWNVEMLLRPSILRAMKTSRVYSSPSSPPPLSRLLIPSLKPMEIHSGGDHCGSVTMPFLNLNPM